MVYARQTIETYAFDRDILKIQIDAVNAAKDELDDASILYTKKLLQLDPGTVMNKIAKLIHSACAMTRNTVNVIKKGIEEIVGAHDTPSNIRDLLQTQLTLIESDKAAHGGKYMSQRFKHQRIPKIMEALHIYAQMILADKQTKEINDLKTQIDSNRTVIFEGRQQIRRILEDAMVVDGDGIEHVGLFPNLGMAGEDGMTPEEVEEVEEAKEVFITHIINNYSQPFSSHMLFHQRFLDIDFPGDNSSSDFEPRKMFVNKNNNSSTNGSSNNGSSYNSGNAKLDAALGRENNDEV